MKKQWIILGIIFCVALLLRVLYLNNIPNGLQLDELNAGYQGYKILATGSDIYGNHLPLYVDRFGDYRAGGIFYLAGLGTLLFGFTNFAVRLPVAIIGALTIFPLFFLTKLISKNNKIAYLSAILLTISPWHIITSRATSESLVSLFLTLIGTIFLIKGLREKRIIFFVFSFLTFIASYFFYPTPRVFVPLFIFLITAAAFIIPYEFDLPKHTKGKRNLFILLLGIIIVTVGITFTKFGTGRFNQTSIFANTGVKEHIKALDDGEKGNILLAKIFDNKPVIYGVTFINQYFSYFSTEFLYIKGGLPERYVVPDMGLFYYIELPLFVLGLYLLLHQKKPFFLIPLFWLIAAPFGASLTLEDSPNIQRAIMMVIPFMIIEAYGIYLLWTLFTSKIKYVIGTVIFLAFFLNMIYFLHMYFIQSPSHVSFMRNDGNDRLFSYLSQKENKYNIIYLSSHEDLPMYFLFDTNNKTQLLSTTREKYSQGYTNGKYVFIPFDCPSSMIPLGSARILTVDNMNCQRDSSLSVIKTIVRKDATDGYFISENKSN